MDSILIRSSKAVILILMRNLNSPFTFKRKVRKLMTLTSKTCEQRAQVSKTRSQRPPASEAKLESTASFTYLRILKSQEE